VADAKRRGALHVKVLSDDEDLVDEADVKIQVQRR